MTALTANTGTPPHRYAELAITLAGQLRAEQNTDACAHWLAGELPDPLDRWAFIFFLAELAVQPGDTAAFVLQRLWRPERTRAA